MVYGTFDEDVWQVFAPVRAHAQQQASAGPWGGLVLVLLAAVDVDRVRRHDVNLKNVANRLFENMEKKGCWNLSVNLFFKNFIIHVYLQSYQIVIVIRALY